MKKCPVVPGAKAPIVLNLMVTDACNLQCAHCYVDSCPVNSSAGYMKPEQLELVLKSLAREDVELVHLFGGEPFLHPGIQDLCEMCRVSGYPVNIATNGTLVQKHLPWIKKNGISLSINLVGDDPRLEMILDCKYPLEGVARNAAAAVQRGIDVNGIICAFPVTSTPAENARFYVEYMHRMHDATGIQSFFILYFSRLGRGKLAWERLDPSFFMPEQWLAFLKDMREGLSILKPPFSVFVEPAFEDDAFSMLPPPPVQCEMIMEANVVIKYDMTAYPCILLLNSDNPRHKFKFDGNLAKLDAAFADVQARTITRGANTCKFCGNMPYCCPCIPYIQDELKDYRCPGNTNKILLGCPLATVRLY
nr:radical SAM protein [Candidatus Sigynarchaeota archaeon]